MLKVNFIIMRNCFKILLLLTTVFLFAGCCGTNSVCFPQNYKVRDFNADLKKQGVLIIKTGETVTIVVPSDKLFNPDSANVSANGNFILTSIVEYMRGYEVVFMKVSGFTDACGSFLRDRVLSEKQAQRVARYLAQNKIDTRIIYTEGFGPERPVANSDTPAGAAVNRRIEIRFRYVVIPPV